MRGDLLDLLERRAHPSCIRGPIIEAHLPGVSIGELCLIHASVERDEVVGRAQVVGFGRDVAILSTLGSTTGLSRRAVLVPTGEPFTIEVSPQILGTVIDSTGQRTEIFRSDELDISCVPERRMNVDVPPPNYSERRPITRPLETGIRVIDGLLTCGVGQRFGIFASAGCGKTALMKMLIEHSAAEVYVIALIGERGREVAEFVEKIKHSSRRNSTIVVYATSDRSSVDRCNAALVATTIAEYFRDLGQDVMLLLDSMTRYARAMRDVALAAGEMPARRGYPASVFEGMPRLLERPGQTARGSITAFFTVLLENEEEPDPIGDEIRSLLDGHIYLSQKLAGMGHFPAVDVLRSGSRLFDQLADPSHRQLVKQFRQHLVRSMRCRYLSSSGSTVEAGTRITMMQSTSAQRSMCSFSSRLGSRQPSKNRWSSWMKRFVKAKKLIGLLEHRSSQLRWQMQHQRNALAELDRELVHVRAEMDKLVEELSKHTTGKCYDRIGLMRARGRQAAIKFGITCRKLQELDLIEDRERINHLLQSCKKSGLVLEQRQKMHRNWLARKRLRHHLLKESTTDVEFMEGRNRGNQRY